MNLTTALELVRKVLTPAQICWICLLSTGSLYTYAVKAFASTSEVKAIHIRITENNLFELRSRQCEAIRREQSGAAYRAKIQELLREYRQLTGGDYPLPECKEL